MTDCACGSEQTCTTAPAMPEKQALAKPLAGFSGGLLSLFGVVVGLVVLLVVLAEWLGLLDALTDYVPWPVWLAAVGAGGYPIFRAVLRATLKRRVTSHTLMTMGLVPNTRTTCSRNGSHFRYCRRAVRKAEQSLTSLLQDRASNRLGWPFLANALLLLGILPQ